MKSILTLTEKELLDLGGKLSWINLKIDQTCLIAKSDDFGKLKYYGREGRVELDTIKRAGQNTWDDAIAHLDSISNIPPNIEIHLELFNENLNTIIKYKAKPLNNLMISNVVDSNGNIMNPNSINILAKHIKVSSLPIVESACVFEGIHRVYYGDIPYSVFVSTYLNLDTSWYIQDYLAYGHEGFVFHFRNGESFKLINPDFTIKFKEKGSDDDIFLNLCTFAWDKLVLSDRELLNMLSKVKLGENSDMNYIKLCQTISNFISSKYDSEFNYFIGNWKSDVNVQECFHGTNDDLFRVYLNGLRKPRTRISKKIGIDLERKKNINNFISSLHYMLDGIEKVQVIQGRFQPFHIGHLNMIKSTENPIVVIIRGEGTSKDKVNNPFDEIDQSLFFEECIPNIRIIYSTSGYLPDNISLVENKFNVKVNGVVSGEDRVKEYKRQLHTESMSDLTFHISKRLTSSSDLKYEARLGGSIDRFLPKELHKYSKLIIKKIKGLNYV